MSSHTVWPDRTLKLVTLHSQYSTGVLSGENRVVADEVELLRGAGHQVELFSPTVSPHSSRLRLATDAIWSRSAVAQVASLVGDARPDVVHVHSVFPRLSPAVLRAVGDRPIVMTLHNFRLQCLPATFLRGTDVCEDCLGHLPWRGVMHGCYRGSRPASAAMATSLALHRGARSFERVTRFLAVSTFVRRQAYSGGNRL